MKKSRKKILFIQNTLSGGGAEKVLIDILSQFDYEKYDVTLLLYIKTGVYLNQVNENVTVKNILTDNILNKWILKIFSKTFKTLDKNFIIKLWLLLVVNKKYDVIVSFIEGLSLQLHGMLAKKAPLNITWVHTDLNTLHLTKNLFSNGMEEKSYNKMDKIVFVSKDAKEQFNLKFSNIETKKVVVYNLILRERIQSLACKSALIKKKKLTISTVGRLTYPKAVHRLILCVSKLVNSGYDIDLWILGDGELKNDLFLLTKELDILDNVHFLGFQPNPYPYVALSDIYVMTSLTEGYPLVLCEALCIGKPILATRTTGSIEILNNGEFGILVNHDDQSIYDGLVTLIKDEDLRNYYSKQSIERSSQFDIKATMEKIYNLLNTR